MPFVVDASVAASWLLPDEQRARAAYARLEHDDAVTPALFWLEMRNLFLMNERRGRIDATMTDRALALLAALPITLDSAPDGPAIMALARRHRLSAYDAAYLELAQRLNVPLATLDAALQAAARAEDVAVLTD